MRMYMPMPKLVLVSREGEKDMTRKAMPFGEMRFEDTRDNE
jgi:hypothetical protein